jgi:hypothetical protein
MMARLRSMELKREISVKVRLVSIFCETFEKCPYFVIPAKAGIQMLLKRLDPRLHGNDN